MKITSKQQLIYKYNELCDRSIKQNITDLNYLSDSDLWLWIAGNGYAFHGNWQYAIKNADSHFKHSSRSQIVNTFMDRYRYPDKEKLVIA